MGMSPAREYPGIADALREMITNGRLAQGSIFPSEGELAARFGVARNTLRRALAEIQREGLVAVVPGKGRVVCPPGGPRGQADELLTAYRRIAAELRQEIEHGAHTAGGRLPSEMELARSYGVSRETARRALTELQAAGLVTVVHGKGRFVRRDATAPSGTS